MSLQLGPVFFNHMRYISVMAMWHKASEILGVISVM